MFNVPTLFSCSILVALHVLDGRVTLRPSRIRAGRAVSGLRCDIPSLSAWRIQFFPGWHPYSQSDQSSRNLPERLTRPCRLVPSEPSVKYQMRHETLFRTPDSGIVSGTSWGNLDSLRCFLNRIDYTPTESIRLSSCGVLRRKSRIALSRQPRSSFPQSSRLRNTKPGTLGARCPRTLNPSESGWTSVPMSY